MESGGNNGETDGRNQSQIDLDELNEGRNMTTEVENNE
jgi:hypothetical protein